MAFADPQSLHNPATGTSPPATWGDQVRDNDLYLWERGPYICTAATRPGAPFEGQVIYETDTDLYLSYTGAAWVQMLATGAWTAFTTTVNFGATAATVTQDCRYTRVGRLIIAKFALRFTNLNGGTGNLFCTLPVAPKAITISDSDFAEPLGFCTVYDLSTTDMYSFVAHVSSASMVMRSFASPGAFVTHASPITIAVGALGTGDELWATITYEAAS